MRRMLLVLMSLAPALLGVSVAGVSAPVSITLPEDATPYPEIAGVSSDAVNSNCRACHSASMVTNQPRLTRAEWTAEVAKMRNVYKAPIETGDDAAIIDWLVAMSERQPAG